MAMGGQPAVRGHSSALTTYLVTLLFTLLNCFYYFLLLFRRRSSPYLLGATNCS